VRGGIDDPLPVLVDGGAEQPRLEKGHALRFELVDDAHRPLCESGRGNAIALVVVDVELGRRAVLLRGVAEALGLHHREHLIAELIADEDGAARERCLPDLVAHQVCRRVDDSLAVLVCRVAETQGFHD
jgi:hypothetical protein